MTESRAEREKSCIVLSAGKKAYCQGRKNDAQAPPSRIWASFNRQLFLSEYAFCPHASGESG